MKCEIYSAAIRGRYHDGVIKQHIEFRSNEYINALTTVQKDNVIVEFFGNIKKRREGMRIVCEKRSDEGIRFFKDGCCGTIRTINAGGDKIVIEFEWENPSPVLVGGIGEKNFGKQYRQGNRVYDAAAIAMACLSSPVGNTGGYSYLYKINEKENVKVRKLTPKECYRLMGFSDEDYEKARLGMNENCYGGKDKSSSQLYKQAGNSIVVDVLYYIMKNLKEAMPYLFETIEVGSFFSGIGAFEKALARLD